MKGKVLIAMIHLIVMASVAASNRSIAIAADGNTAFGDGALQDVHAGMPPGVNNSAFGNNALRFDLQGSGNTAVGAAAMFTNTSGNNNTATGLNALHGNQSGSENTAIGANSLSSNTAGSANTATGFGALSNNTEGVGNTASGQNALADNLTGQNNTATGQSALLHNTSGSFNTADGQNSMFGNTTGANNTAIGYFALLSNSKGSNNTAEGASALADNTTGQQNTAVGLQAMSQNTTGSFNTADGVSALNSNTTGQKNAAFGLKALFNNTTGQSNTALGFGAGSNLTTGSNNIEIANGGAPSDDKVIRIGMQGTQTSTIIAGISGSAVTGADVVVNGMGKLGVVASSARYKTDIKEMGVSTNNLMKLRPVTFRYRNDDHAITQYGLVAEEVEKVYPELVTYDADGKGESVRYSMLTSMLLNELQRQTRRNQVHAEQLAAQAEKINQLWEQQADLTRRLESLERTPRHLASVHSVP